MSDERRQSELATIAWEGDSREALRDFPEGAKEALGFQLWQLQQGERPSDYRPLPSIGMGVFELRERDELGLVSRDLPRASLLREKESRDAAQGF